MNRNNNPLLRYAAEHSTPPSSLLHELYRETHLKTLAPQMASGPLQGRVLALFSKMLQPKSILEIGTFTGYATLCLAEGLAAEGTIHTIEGNPELAYFLKKYAKRAGRMEQIKQYIGDAKMIIPTIDGNFDLVFIDAGKKDNALYFDLTIDRLRVGGLILVDNTLWDGKVARNTSDSDTSVIDQFNKKVRNDPRVETVLLPIRDGLTVLRRL